MEHFYLPDASKENTAAREIVQKAIFRTLAGRHSKYLNNWLNVPLGHLFPSAYALHRLARLIHAALQRYAKEKALPRGINFRQKRRYFYSRQKPVLKSLLMADLGIGREQTAESLIVKVALQLTKLHGVSQPVSIQIAPSGHWGDYRDGMSDVPEELQLSSPLKPTKHPKVAEDAVASVVRVFYATDRSTVKPSKIGMQYGRGRSDKGLLRFGECEVSIPKNHLKGKLESPRSFLRIEIQRRNPEKHVLLQKTLEYGESRFFEELAKSSEGSDAKDAFVFVHGYNVSFEDAARRAGQIAYDLEFVCTPIFYSWPSNGLIQRYVRDETEITWTAPHFRRFMELLIHQNITSRIHIIAHSMGNRAVCESLSILSANPDIEMKFAHLVLAAPDIDAQTFEEQVAALQKTSGRITLYESSNDKALAASKQIHGHPRAGEPLLVIPGVDTIDASKINTDFLGHSYFSGPRLLDDMHSLLFKNEPPNQRSGLTELTNKVGTYYEFTAEGVCQATEA